MKKLLWIFLFSFISYAQVPIENRAILLPQGYGLKFLNSSGSSAIVNDVSNVSFMNPAVISELQNNSVGISYQFNTAIKDAWIADIGLKRNYNFYPQSFGAVVKWSGFTFGFGYGQKYNAIKEFSLLVTTVQQPNGTGEFINLTEENFIQSYSVSSSYSLQEVLGSKFGFNAGLKYSLNRFNQLAPVDRSEIKAVGFYSSFGLGLAAQFILDEQRYLKVGVDFEIATQCKADVENSFTLVVSYDSNSVRPNQYAVLTSKLIYNSPSELNIDFAFDATNDLLLLAGLHNVFWSVSNDKLKDQLEISFSSVYKFSDNVNTSIGFYLSDYKYKKFNQYFPRLNTELDALFITAGLKLKFSKFSFDISFADSHLFSGDYKKQTIGKLSIGINL